MIKLYVIISCIIWLVFFIKTTLTLLRVDCLEDLSESPPSDLPLLSIIIAARNEAKTLPDAVATILSQDYRNIELIIVNDRSTDETGRIIDTIKASDNRVGSIDIEELPDGWLGKVHAIAKGIERAAGEWVLFTDADVHFRPDGIKNSLAYAIVRELDHLAIMPNVDFPTFLVEHTVQAFGAIFLFAVDAGKAARNNPDAFIGIGAFNLVKRSALDRTEGLSWLALEVADDVGLAKLLKRAGASAGFLFSKGSIFMTWYSSIIEMFRGFEKNLFASVGRYSLIRTISIAISILAISIAPFIGLLNHMYIPPLAAYSALFLSSITGLRKLDITDRGITRSVLSIIAAIIPIGIVLISMMLLWSGLIGFLRGGIRWRDTFYSIKELKSGQRV